MSPVCLAAFVFLNSQNVCIYDVHVKPRFLILSAVLFFLQQLLLSLSSPSSPTPLYMYLDFHAHAARRGCFFFGNIMPSDPTGQVDAYAYPRLVAMHTPHIDLSSCIFTEEGAGGTITAPSPASRADAASAADADVDAANTVGLGVVTTTTTPTTPTAATLQKGEQDKEGSGRAAIYAATFVPLCFTIEANYNTGKFAMAIPPATNDGGRSTPPSSSSSSAGATMLFGSGSVLGGSRRGGGSR